MGEIRRTNKQQQQQHPSSDFKRVDFLVPICVLIENQPQNTFQVPSNTTVDNVEASVKQQQQQNAPKSQPKIDSIGWSVIESATSRVVLTRTLKVSSTTKVSVKSCKKSQHRATSACSLADALAEVSASLQDETDRLSSANLTH